jgi:hypothetical protein
MWLCPLSWAACCVVVACERSRDAEAVAASWMVAWPAWMPMLALAILLAGGAFLLACVGRMLDEMGARAWVWATVCLLVLTWCLVGSQAELGATPLRTLGSTGGLALMLGTLLTVGVMLLVPRGTEPESESEV